MDLNKKENIRRVSRSGKKEKDKSRKEGLGKKEKMKRAKKNW